VHVEPTIGFCGRSMCRALARLQARASASRTVQCGFMPHRSRLRNWVEYAFALVVLKSLQWTPIAAADALGGATTPRCGPLGPALAAGGGSGILCWRCRSSMSAGRSAIIDGVSARSARLLRRLARFPSIGPHNLTSGYASREPSMWMPPPARAAACCSPRRTWGMELSAFAHGQASGPMSILVRPLDKSDDRSAGGAPRGLRGNRVIFKRISRGRSEAARRNDKVGT